jgi:dephospho-CoA kinase
MLKKLSKLNSIIHPFVKEHFSKWLQSHKENKYIIKEAAILFESGSDKGLDKIITVAAPEEIRIHRVMERDKVTEEGVRSRMKNQMPEEERIKQSDYIITNDNQTLVIPQVLNLHRLFLNGSG